MPPRAPRTIARPIDPPIEPPTDLPRSAAIEPAVRLTTERVISRDQLPGAHPLAARAVGAEDAAEDATDLPDPAAACVILARLLVCRPGGGLVGDALGQHLVGGFGIDCRVVLTLQRALGDDRLALVGADRSEAGRRRADHGALDDGGNAVALQKRHQRLALAELGNDLRRVEAGVWPEGVGGGLDRLLVARREGAQGMLNAVAELG